MLVNVSAIMRRHRAPHAETWRMLLGETAEREGTAGLLTPGPSDPSLAPTPDLVLGLPRGPTLMGPLGSPFSNEPETWGPLGTVETTGRGDRRLGGHGGVGEDGRAQARAV